MRWMRRWLLNKDDAPVEGDFPIATDAELQCTRTGQVLTDLKGKSVFDLNAEQDGELTGKRGKLPREQLLAEVRRLCGVIDLRKTFTVDSVKESGIERKDVVIHSLVFRPEAGIQLSALHFQPEKDEGKRLPLVVYVHGDGKTAHAGPGGPIEQLARAGHRVLAVDLRGTGETAPGTPSPKGPNYFGVDSKEAFLALHLNRPLLGQRVSEVLALLEYARTRENRISSFQLVGVGSAGPIALHAAALHDAFEQVTIERSVLSWSAVVHTPLSHNQLTNVVPGALAVYDLPDLAAQIAPRRLTIRNVVDAAGKPVSQTTLEEVYARCREAYRTAKGPLTLQAGP